MGRLVSIQAPRCPAGSSDACLVKHSPLSVLAIGWLSEGAPLVQQLRAARYAAPPPSKSLGGDLRPCPCVRGVATVEPRPRLQKLEGLARIREQLLRLLARPKKLGVLEARNRGPERHPELVEAGGRGGAAGRVVVEARAQPARLRLDERRLESPGQPLEARNQLDRLLPAAERQQDLHRVWKHLLAVLRREHGGLRRPQRRAETLERSCKRVVQPTLGTENADARGQQEDPLLHVGRRLGIEREEAARLRGVAAVDTNLRDRHEEALRRRLLDTILGNLVGRREGVVPTPQQPERKGHLGERRPLSAPRASSARERKRLLQVPERVFVPVAVELGVGEVEVDRPQLLEVVLEGELAGLAKQGEALLLPPCMGGEDRPAVEGRGENGSRAERFAHLRRLLQHLACPFAVAREDVRAAEPRHEEREVVVRLVVRED